MVLEMTVPFSSIFAVQKMLLSSGKCSAISSILQWRMLQSLSSVATVTFLLCLRRFS